MISTFRLGLATALSLFAMAVVLGAAPWTGGRGDGNRGAFPGVPFPKSPAVVWKAYIGDSYVDTMPSNAVVADKTVIVAYGRNLLALSTETGEARWAQELSEVPVDDLLLLDNLVLVSGASGQVTAYRPATGELAWQQRLSDRIRNGPIYDNNTLFFATMGGKLDGVKRDSGELLGSLDVRGKVEAAPLLLGKNILLCYTDGKITRVDGNKGVVQWAVQLPNAVVSLTPVTNGRMVVVNTTNTLYGLNPFDRNAPVRWSYPIAQRLHEPVALDGDTVYVVTRNARLYAIELATGADRWKRTVVTVTGGKQEKRDEPGITLLAPPVATPLAVGKYLVVRMENGLMALYAKDTGKLEWTYRLQAPEGLKAPTRAAMGGPAIDGDHLYFAGSDGNIYYLSSSAPDVEPPAFSSALPKDSEKGFLDAKNVSYVGAIINDEGSGVQPDQVSMRLDTTELTPSVQFDARSGYYYVGLSPQTPLAPGMHRLVISARDNRGNAGTMAMSFIIGTATTAESVPVTILGEFTPKHLRVTPGTIITWVNKSGAVRTIVSDTGEFSSDAQYPDGIPNGESWVWIVPDDAEYGTEYFYHCRLNGKAGGGQDFGTGLVGLIEVAEPILETPVEGGPPVPPGGMPPGGMPPAPGGPWAVPPQPAGP